MWSVFSKCKMKTSKMSFEEFCESTGLHGWKYIGLVSWKVFVFIRFFKLLLSVHFQPKSKERYVWLIIVIGALGVAIFFLYMAIADFTSATVVTNIETTTAPLSEVFFPAIILCSINQIRQSLFKVRLARFWNSSNPLWSLPRVWECPTPVK